MGGRTGRVDDPDPVPEECQCPDGQKECGDCEPMSLGAHAEVG